MGFLDKLKGTANMAKQKAAETVDQHGPQIKDGIGKAGGYLDKKTKGKYSDKIAQGTQKAGEAMDKRNEAGADPTPPPGPVHSAEHDPHVPQNPSPQEPHQTEISPDQVHPGTTPTPPPGDTGRTTF